MAERTRNPTSISYRTRLPWLANEARAIRSNNQCSLPFSSSFTCRSDKIPAKPEPLCTSLHVCSSEKVIMLLFLLFVNLSVSSYPPISIPWLYLGVKGSGSRNPQRFIHALFPVLFSALGTEMVLWTTGMMLMHLPTREDSDSGERFSLSFLVNCSSSPLLRPNIWGSNGPRA